jgi:O-antigen biosynthesis protein
MTPSLNSMEHDDVPSDGTGPQSDANLRGELHAANQRIDMLERELRNARKDVAAAARIQGDATRLKDEIERLHRSHSWRVTAPLRRVATLVVATRRILDAANRQVRLGGGVSQSIVRATSILREQGLSGLRRAVARIGSTNGYKDVSDDVYQAWIDRYDTITPALRAEIQQRLPQLVRRPKISLIVPTYNSDARYLREMIASVRAQLYPDWELCIADDASPQPHVKEILAEEMARDVRIKTRLRESNGHISEASNSALELATGDYVALLDHDDILPEHALFLVAQYINAHPEARMFYSDEDKLTTEGKRTSPYFKSDWNPELMRAQNMYSHLGVYETSLVREAGGFRKGFEGSQDYDLALRCVDLAGHDKVVHIPHVLYHWRIAEGSTAKSGNEKPYAMLAAIRSVEEHLKRNRIEATVEQAFGRLPILHVSYALPSPAPLVSLLIPTRDGLALLKQCVESVIAKTRYPNYEIVIIDNGSVKPETLAWFKSIEQEHANVRVTRDDSPFNFSALNNRAAHIAKGEYLCLLNNDIEVISRDWLDEMVGIACQPRNGAVGASLWYPNDTLQHGGVLIGLGGVAGHMHRLMQRGHAGYFGRGAATQNLSAVTAACLVVRKSIYMEVGGLEEELEVAFNDIDFCLKVREAGYRNVWTAHAELYHHESATRGSDMDPDKYDRFVGEVRWMERRWGAMFDNDPAYNRNLTLDAQVLPFSLSDPPRFGMLD